jgi:hypothetical protein
MKFKHLLIALLASVVSFTIVLAVQLKINSSRGGLILDMPLTSEWTQSATVASDRTPQRNNGTATGTPPTFGSDGVDLNGSSDYIDLGDADVFSHTDGAGNDQPFSVSAWAEMDSAVRFQFMRKDGVTANREWVFVTDASSKLGLVVFTDSNNYIGQLSDSAVTSYQDTWALFTATYDGSESSSGIKLYIDGSLVASSDFNNGTHTGMTNGTDPLEIGRISTGSTYADGKEAHAKMWNRELTAAEILDIYNKGRTGNDQKINTLQKGLKFYMPLTDTYLQTPVLASDVTPYGNHATTDRGSATYSSTGYELDGSTDSLVIPSTGIFNTANQTIAFRFTPDFNYDEAVQRSFFDATADERYILIHQAAGDLNLFMGNTNIASVQSATYSQYWNQNQENTIIISGTTGDTDMWLNGNLILDSDASAWTPDNPANLYIGAFNVDTGQYDGELRDFAVWDRILTAAERTLYENLGGGNNQKINTLHKGLKFHMPLTDTYLQTSVLASDVSPAHNHADTSSGTPTYSSTGMELGGSSDYIQATAPGIFGTSTTTVAFRFTPDFAANDGTQHNFFDTENGASRYFLTKAGSAVSNAMRVQFGNTIIQDIPLASYSDYWNVDQENTMIISATDSAGSPLTNAWLNGNQILTNDATSWTAASNTNLMLGTNATPTPSWDGELRDFAVWDRILTAVERTLYENSSSL